MKNNCIEPFFSAIGMVVNDNEIWFPARETNGLFCMGPHGKNLKYIGAFPGESEDDNYLYGQCVIVKQLICFAPYNAENFAVYDIDKQKFEVYPLGDNGKNKYLTIVNWKNQLMLLPAQKGNDIIIKISIDSGNIEYIENWIDKFAFNEGQEKLFWDYCVADDILYAPIISARGQILRYDFRSNEVSCIDVGVQESFRCICCDEKHFYLTSQIGNVMTVVDRDFRYVRFETIANYKEVRINNEIYQNGHVFLYTINDFDSSVPDMIIEFDTKKEQANVVRSVDLKQAQQNICGIGRLYAICEQENIIKALNGGNGVLYEINSCDMTVCENKISTVDMREIVREKYKRTKGNIRFCEKRVEATELDTVLDMVENMKEIKVLEKSKGATIWGNLK